MFNPRYDRLTAASSLDMLGRTPTLRLRPHPWELEQPVADWRSNLRRNRNLGLNLLTLVSRRNPFPFKRNIFLFGLIMHSNREPDVRCPILPFVSLTTSAALTANLLIGLVYQSSYVGHVSCTKRGEQIISKEVWLREKITYPKKSWGHSKALKKGYQSHEV